MQYGANFQLFVGAIIISMVILYRWATITWEQVRHQYKLFFHLSTPVNLRTQRETGVQRWIITSHDVAILHNSIMEAIAQHIGLESCC